MTLQSIPSALPRPLSPAPSAFSKPFWDALAEGRFMATQCPSCALLRFPPRPVCPACLSDACQWTEISGAGVLYSRTRIHAAGAGFASRTPYSVGLIDLVDGPRILTRLLHSASDLSPDSAVQLVVVQHIDGPLFAAVSASDQNP